jgi:hypothetical protein
MIEDSKNEICIYDKQDPDTGQSDQNANSQDSISS